MNQFETGKTYSARSIGDHTCVWTFKVISRTEKSVVLQDEDGQSFRRSIALYNGEETVRPLGSYSMAPVLRAGRVVA